MGVKRVPEFEHSLLSLSNKILADIFVEPLYKPLPIPWPRARAVVLWTGDGLGRDVLQKVLEGDTLAFWKKRIQSSNGGVLPTDSVFPTTTASALATLHFAVPPSVHGALGYTLWDPELLTTINVLSAQDLLGKVLPSTIYKHRKTIYDSSAANHVKSWVISPASHSQSAFSQWVYHGALYCGYNSPSQIPGLVLSAHKEEARFIVVYWPGFDRVGHLEEKDSLAAKKNLKMLDQMLQASEEKIGKDAGVRFVLTSDHGLIDLYREQYTIPGIFSRPFVDERRALYTDWNWIAMRRRLTRAGWHEALCVPVSQLWEEGYFGRVPADSRVLFRTLQSVIFPGDHQQLIMPGAEAPVMAAGHGGLTDQERQIFVSWWSISTQ